MEQSRKYPESWSLYFVNNNNKLEQEKYYKTGPELIELFTTHAKVLGENPISFGKGTLIDCYRGKYYIEGDSIYSVSSLTSEFPFYIQTIIPNEEEKSISLKGMIRTNKMHYDFDNKVVKDRYERSLTICVREGDFVYYLFD